MSLDIIQTGCLTTARLGKPDARTLLGGVTTSATRREAKGQEDAQKPLHSWTPSCVK